MKKLIFFNIFTLFFLANIQLFSQFLFLRSVGGTGNDDAFSIVQTSDGGYAVAGYISSFNSDLYVVKLDSAGTLQWNKAIGSADNSISEYGQSIVQTTDGGFVIAGRAGRDVNGSADCYIVKLDISGDLQWSKTIGGPGDDIAYSICQTSDGGYAFTGTSQLPGSDSGDCYISKLDNAGNLLWSKTVGYLGNEVAYSISQTFDGGYIICGATNSYSNSNQSLVIKLDNDGNLQWNKIVVGGITAYTIVQTNDGGYALTGMSNVGGNGMDCHIVKLGISGDLKWTKTIGGASYDYALSIIQTNDNGYAISGYTTSFGAGGDCYVVKVDSIGNLQWSKAIGGTGWEFGNSIIQTNDGGYAIGGNTKSFGSGNMDVFIAKLDSEGNTCGNFTSPSSLSGSGGYVTTHGLNVISRNHTDSSQTPLVSTRGNFTNICTTSGVVSYQNEIPSFFTLFQNYPNPFNPETKIKFQLPTKSSVRITIYDNTGRELISLVDEVLTPGTYEASWDAVNYPSGIYFYKMRVGGFIQTRKMILLK